MWYEQSFIQKVKSAVHAMPVEKSFYHFIPKKNTHIVSIIVCAKEDFSNLVANEIP